MGLDAILAQLDANRDSARERLFELIRIPSISTDHAYRGDCRRAADWLAAELNALGADATVRETPGHPMVVGHIGDSGPHYVFYGHYDVQPPDPLELWETPPFEPVVMDEGDGPVIRARGASDDKGQIMTMVEAVRAILAVDGKLPCRLTFFFEGEEESGSPSLVPFLKENAAELSADLALICDTGLHDRDTPAICTQLRGMVTEEVFLTGASRDLHSGGYGGPAINPIRVLALIIAGLHDDSGRVALPGFYDGVHEVPANIRESWDRLGFDGARFLGEVGLSVPAGERGRSVQDQIWARPTCEVNGITGGYTGEGFKTVLPAKASAKISFRLVGDQDPQAIRAAFRDYVTASLPADVSAEFRGYGADRAMTVDTSNPAFEAARQSLIPEWPNEAVFTGGGGSIPVGGHFKEVLGLDSLFVGFALSDRIHSPNEKYDLRSFEKGARSWARILYALGA